MESECVFGCCGFDAFNFSTAHTAEWVGRVGADAAEEALAQARSLRLIVRGLGGSPDAMGYPIGEHTAESAGELLDYAVWNLTEVLRPADLHQLEDAPAPVRPAPARTAPAEPIPWPVKLIAITLMVPVVAVAFVICFPFLVYIMTRQLIRALNSP